MKKQILSATLAVSLIFFSCQKKISESKPFSQEEVRAVANNNPAEQINTFKGPEVHVANGKIRSYIKVNHLNQPLELGLEMTEGSLTGLPVDEVEGQPNPTWIIPLHAKAKELTPYDHVYMGWNPHGHEPDIRRVPHFDYHFYKITEDERMAIPPYTPGSPHDILPPPDYRPAGYIPFPGGVVAMGKHWAVVPPVLPFTEVMILGSYNGKMIFDEPMITLDYLQSGASTSNSFGQPLLFPEPGNYPTTYNIYKTGDKHYVSLSQFVAR